MCLSCVFLVLGKSEKKEAEREENKGIEGTFHHGGLSGLFFLVTGFFLEWKEIVLLLISGQFFCGIFGLAMAVSVMTIGGGNGNLRKIRLPFLPFLLPTALWMAVMRVL